MHIHLHGKSDAFASDILNLFNSDDPSGDLRPWKRRKMNYREQTRLDAEQQLQRDHLIFALADIDIILATDGSEALYSSCTWNDNGISVRLSERREIVLEDSDALARAFSVLDGNDRKRELCEFHIRASDSTSNTGVASLSTFLSADTIIKLFMVDPRQGLFRLEVKVVWANSQSLADAKSDLRNSLLAQLTPDGGTPTRQDWTPRTFYDSVHVPSQDGDMSFEVKGLKSRLYPFQKRALKWMLYRERVMQVVESMGEEGDDLPMGFFRTKDLTGRPCYVNHWLGIATTNEDVAIGLKSGVQGGILAEEMGLGKTVEVTALITNHPRNMDQGSSVDMCNLHKSKTTLIIAPPSILQQWKSELDLHAPHLGVLIYPGIKLFTQHLTDRRVFERLGSHDVVLTTYSVLANEIHYADKGPDRDLRHAKKYVKRTSPLIRIDWWRVVLDECQMVESGLSNAAKVARLIPRQNAWAVSGTPLRKDVLDLFGLLTFLKLEPFCHSKALWYDLVSLFTPLLKQLFSKIALRHTKDHIRDEIRLPPQSRFVINVPFTQVEEQHYETMFQEMCDEVGVSLTGAPLHDRWDPDNPQTIAKMRQWLGRLRQTCLHPEVGGHNRRALGKGEGPLRTVDEVLQVMIDQNDTAMKAEERAVFSSRLLRGQYAELQKQSEEALKIWSDVLQEVKVVVEECRMDLEAASADELALKVKDDEESPITVRLGMLRSRLRSVLEIEHTATYFVASAHFQIKEDKDLIEPESDKFIELERLETEGYDMAKAIRRELLKDTTAKVENFTKLVVEKDRKFGFITVSPCQKMKYTAGIETGKIYDQIEQILDALNTQRDFILECRKEIIKRLSTSLIDHGDNAAEGDEYETTMKQQDEVYAYVLAIRALVADRHEILLGQENPLLRKETLDAMYLATQGRGHAPELMARLLEKRLALKPPSRVWSLRAAITQLKMVKVVMEDKAQRRDARAAIDAKVISFVLDTVTADNSRQIKSNSALEAELLFFHDVMNARLEYFRQLQAISDSVVRLEDSLPEKKQEQVAVLGELNVISHREHKSLEKLAMYRSRARYLLHLRKESTNESPERKCIICQEMFDVGSLTSCGHTFCKECLNLWLKSHSTCPTCKKHMGRNDLHQITYRQQEMTMQEETVQKTVEADSDLASVPSIYSGISKEMLNDLQSIDLKKSFGTKIDTLARHVLWLRQHKPGSKSIIFSQFKDFLSVLAMAFRRQDIRLTSIDYRNGIEEFKKKDDIECFFLHARAHSSGLNLINATHVFLCEPLINTAIELQAIARIHRIGQHHPTTVCMYLVEGTVEKAIYEVSVGRRMAHIQHRGSGIRGKFKEKSEIKEEDIEAANSMELEQTSLAKLMMSSGSGGEMVAQDDLWTCLFNSRQNGRRTGGLQVPEEVEMAAARFLGAEAVEERIRTSNGDSRDGGAELA